MDTSGSYQSSEAQNPTRSSQGTKQQPLQWNPPDFHHFLIPEAPTYDMQCQYRLHDRHPPDRLHF